MPLASCACAQLLLVPTKEGPLLVWCSETRLMGDHTPQDGPQRLRVCAEAQGAGSVREIRDVLPGVAGTGFGFYSGRVGACD